MAKGQDKKERRKITKRTLKYYGAVMLKYKWQTLASLILTPTVVIVRSTLIPLILADMIDTISAGQPLEELSGYLLPRGIILILLQIVVSGFLGELRIYMVWRMELDAMYDLATLCFNAISKQSMSFHSDRFSGSLVSQTNKFIGSFERFFDVAIFNLVYLIAVLVPMLIVLGKRVPLFALALLIFILLYILFSYLSFKKISHLSEEWAAADSRQTGQLSDSVSNILSVKSYGREAYERKRYAKISEESRQCGYAQMKATIKRDIAFSGVNVGIFAAVVAFMIYGTGIFGLSVATLILIVNYSITIVGELWDVNRIFKDINRVFGDAREMTVILDTKDDVVDKITAKPIVVDKGEIDIQGIDFRHKDAKENIFNDFSLHINPGERIGLVGVSGSGKTTLTKLILRFADVQNGNIRIDGQNISDVKQVSLRENIAYVPQETALFHRTIAENIAYGHPNATQAEIEQAAKLANAHEFIKDLPDGYKTLVGERGIKLSGGQRQRIAIARAILKDAPVLILDEATSALDSESEALIQSALVRLMKGRTSIVVAHRLSTIASLDRIVVLKNGKIVEQGSHKELIALGGAYSKLWSRQSGAFIESE